MAYGFKKIYFVIYGLGFCQNGYAYFNLIEQNYRFIKDDKIFIDICFLFYKMSFFRQYIQPYRELWLFLAKALLLFIAWKIFFYSYLSTSNMLDRSIIDFLIRATLSILNGLGYETFHEPVNHIGISGTSGVVIGQPCDGLDLMYLYLAFFIAMPGRIKPKLLFSVAGIALIYFFNVLRLVFLALIVKYNYNWFDFHHSYTFTLSMYLIIFALWYGYLKKYAFEKK